MCYDPLRLCLCFLICGFPFLSSSSLFSFFSSFFFLFLSSFFSSFFFLFSFFNLNFLWPGFKNESFGFFFKVTFFQKITFFFRFLSILFFPICFLLLLSQVPLFLVIFNLGFFFYLDSVNCLDFCVFRFFLFFFLDFFCFF